MTDKKATNIVADVAKITTIPAASLHKLNMIYHKCICSAVYESQINQDTLTDVDIGLGNLIISIEDNALTYKFIPNSKFERDLVATIINKKNPLAELAELTFVDRIINTYKDMF